MPLIPEFLYAEKIIFMPWPPAAGPSKRKRTMCCARIVFCGSTPIKTGSSCHTVIQYQTRRKNEKGN
jgi:hypothetical protein